MCSPVGHSVLSLGLGAMQSNRCMSYGYVAYCLFAGVAADLDFLVGWALGDLNGYHHLGSHSLFAAVIFAGFCWLLLSRTSMSEKHRKTWVRSGFSIYLGHLFLDLVTFDGAEPVGLQLLWPFSNEFYVSAFILFPAFRHETQGGDMIGMLGSVFGRANLATVALELLVLLPTMVIFVWFSRRRARWARERN